MFDIDSSERILNVNKSYDETKSLTEILQSFNLITKDFNDLNKERFNDEFQYSDYNYTKCTDDEKRQYIRKRLQKIETLILDKIYYMSGSVYSMKDILGLLTDDGYAKVDKGERLVAYFTSNNKRPTGDSAYLSWNGIQVIDLDIKDRDTAVYLKEALFQELCKYNWFLCIYFSASGKGLHIWTKITTLTMEFKRRKIEFICNFRHKYSYVYTILLEHMEKANYTKEQAKSFLDMAMAKPQQGIFISSDKQPYFNMNFVDYRLDVNFEGALQCGTESIDWINHPDLKMLFKKLEWFSNEDTDKANDVERTDISDIGTRDYSKNQQKHYKYGQRWQLANTLTAIYGKEAALGFLKECCSGTDTKELAADVNTAARHNKPISLWAVKELNTYHGFKIKVKEDVVQEAIDNAVSKNVDIMEFVNENTTKVELHINKNQYLSDIQDKIVSNLGHITLLEAGAGYGKTEMIKALKSKTLLILPFTSTIKSKIEASETTSDWKYFYGTKHVTFDDLREPNSMSMTIDKFSKLNVMELDEGNFEYIVLDESHLLFTSSYREVMSPAIQRLANCKSKVIMMTGTPTGELLFFPNIKHIKVIKEDNRTKKFDLHMSYNDINKVNDIATYITNDILYGRKVLFPTNNGKVYFEQIMHEVNRNLMNSGFDREARAFYYKKSNYGEQSMENININKSIGDNDIIFCTNYLSVGVDICEEDYTFSIYFDERMIPQDIEQFANRLRKNDLFIHMFLPLYNKDGEYINYSIVENLDLSFEEKELLFIRDLLKMVNDVIERNNEESKYNPLVSSMISANTYVKYDENECKYFVDETTYKLHIFEERYQKYSTQLPIMIQGLKDFGYEYSKHNNNGQMNDTETEMLKNRLKDIRKEHWDNVTRETFEFLDHVTDENIDIYKEIQSGNYDIIKSDDYKEERLDNKLYVNQIEIVEKNTNYIVSLYKYYDIPTIKKIYESCVDSSNKINFSRLNSIITLKHLNDSIKRRKLDIPVWKFVQDVRKWVKENPVVDKTEMTSFVERQSAKYANTIPHVVVEDIELLSNIHKYIKNLFNVLIEASKPKKGKVSLSINNLEWLTKQETEATWGDDNTKDFFEGTSTYELNKQEDSEEEPEIEELGITPKDKLHEVQPTLKSVVHESFDYYDYSSTDGSNERFLRKQENTYGIENDRYGKASQQVIEEQKIDYGLFQELANNNEL